MEIEHHVLLKFGLCNWCRDKILRCQSKSSPFYPNGLCCQHPNSFAHRFLLKGANIFHVFKPLNNLTALTFGASSMPNNNKQSKKTQLKKAWQPNKIRQPPSISLSVRHVKKLYLGGT